MSSRFAETRAKAVRLVKDHVGDHELEWAAIKVISAPGSSQTRRRRAERSETRLGDGR
jgi:hypothetical protein